MNYWERQVSRRRALRATGAAVAVASAISLLGCGSNDDPGGKPSKAVASNAENLKNAKRGGTWQDFIANEPATLDPVRNTTSTAFTETSLLYSLLTHAKLVTRDNLAPPDTEMEPDAAESWEMSPDGLQLTFKLRPNHTFDPRPPTNGRAMTSADVRWSWEYFSKLSNQAADIANSRDPEAPVMGIETPDSQTVKFKLAYPWPDAVAAFGYASFNNLMPAESENFNVKSEPRGAGPFRLQKWEPSVAMNYERNENWHEKDRPYLDGIKRTVIKDASAGLAQFEASNIWTYDVKPGDIIATKERHPELELHQYPNFTVDVDFLSYSALPNSPYRDVRLRRAMSMILDRDLYIETIENASKFEQAGLPTVIRWMGFVGSGSATWIDPKGNGLGEGAKHFKHNLQEAQKLVKAAGYDKFDFVFSYEDNRNLDEAAAYAGMFRDASFINVIEKPLDYNTTWRQVCQSPVGERAQFDGVCRTPRTGYNLANYFQAAYTSGGKFSLATDPKTLGLDTVQPLLSKFRYEFDTKKREELSHQIQKELALQMPAIPAASDSFMGFQLNWPTLANYVYAYAFSGTQPAVSSRPPTKYWYDETKKKT